MTLIPGHASNSVEFEEQCLQQRLLPLKRSMGIKQLNRICLLSKLCLIAIIFKEVSDR